MEENLSAILVNLDKKFNWGLKNIGGTSRRNERISVKGPNGREDTLIMLCLVKTIAIKNLDIFRKIKQNTVGLSEIR